MEDNQTVIIQKAEQFIRRTAPMIGHANGDMLLRLVQLAKKQAIEIANFSSIVTDEARINDIKNISELTLENLELNNFKNATEEVVGDVILGIIEERMADD